MAVHIFDIQEEKEATYRKLVRPRLMDELKEKIFERLVVQKKYKDANYTARRLAEEIHSNVRYVSAVIRVQYHTNYSTFVNQYRVEEAMALLTDQRYDHLNIEDIGYMVGFAHRQSFYTAFQKYAGTTPNAYRMRYQQEFANSKKNNKEKDE